MKRFLIGLLLILPELSFAQVNIEGNEYMKSPLPQITSPDLKLFDYVELDPHLAGEKIYDNHFDPDVVIEPDYKTHTIMVSTGKGHYEYTATECNKDCSSEKWTPEILKAFHSYIQYLGLTEEEFVSRYVLSSFYNPQE